MILSKSKVVGKNQESIQTNERYKKSLGKSGEPTQFENKLVQVNLSCVILACLNYYEIYIFSSSNSSKEEGKYQESI